MQENPPLRQSLTEHLPGTPSVYENPPQDDTARSYAKRLMKILASGQRLDKEESEWLNIYKKAKTAKRSRDDDDDLDDGHTKKDLHMFFMDKIQRMQDNYEKRIENMLIQHRKDLAEKDKRIDDMATKHEEQRDKYYGELAKLTAVSKKEDLALIEKAHNTANGHLVTALTNTNNFNKTIADTITTQWNNASNLSKKNYEELVKNLESRDEPGFWDAFVQDFLMPLAPKLKDAVERNLPALLPAVQK